MRRIDENTYINDRLITCAEYQLFLDEMRAQGQFHQPDHWGSYQYPKGETKEPILGVRHTDAIAFCDWLTKRENGVWGFRLPSHQEGMGFPMQLPFKKPLGYWVAGADGQAQFAWIGPAPEDARGIDLFRAFTRAIERSNVNIIDRERALKRALDLFRIFDLEQALKRALDLEHDLALARTRAQEHARALQLDFAFDLASDVDRNLDRDLDRAIDLARALDRASDRSNALEHALEHALNLALEHNRNIDRTIVFDLVIYIDLLSLQERMAGRSPAFEGIRTVKERVE